MKLTTTTMVTVDGVMQGLGGPDEDRSGGFERGGWVTHSFDNEAMTFLNQVYARADAFLFGRRTYEIFAGSWGTWDDPGDSPIWTALHTLPKYVASTTPLDPTWANTTVISSDVEAAIRDLKARGSGNIYISGSGTLVRALLADGLIDELHLFVYPVVVGGGKKTLFLDASPTTRFRLNDSHVYTNGVVHLNYGPA